MMRRTMTVPGTGSLRNETAATSLPSRVTTENGSAVGLSIPSTASSNGGSRIPAIQLM